LFYISVLLYLLYNGLASYYCKRARA